MFRASVARATGASWQPVNACIRRVQHRLTEAAETSALKWSEASFPELQIRDGQAAEQDLGLRKVVS